ncbi:DNA-deoxyinosine glycosylase [Polymorphobacter sp.]|uniref:DNA-deoxyinosine glycosylase n=1 Tax=Polymorphobacter sp. TaxID=1909290 RepID=UPI003F711636
MTHVSFACYQIGQGMDRPKQPPAPARVASFPAVLGADTRVLLLGSLPGQVSLARAQYYGHPQNQFWRLIGAVLDTDLTALAYPARLAALTGAGIGLWDVIGSAARAGSLDSAIRAPEANPLAALVASLPALAAIGFNGAAAYRLGTAQLAGSAISMLPLPSSSPAYAAINFEAKRARWLALRHFLDRPALAPGASTP